MEGIKQHLGFYVNALALREKRNAVLASNIANAATPNFKARDVDFSAEMAKIEPIGDLKTTDSRHLAAAVNPRPDQMLYRQPLQPSLDGNTVELSVEQMQFSENVVRYQTTLNFINNRISSLMSAIRGE